MKFKKLGLVLVTTLLLVGCNENKKSAKVNNLNTTYNMSDSYYRIASPYKSGINGNYVSGNIKNKYDLQEVETGLMRISTKYYAKDKSFYQRGQYLKTNDLKQLLSTTGLNNDGPTQIESQEVTPTYVSYVFEEDYLKEDGSLKGISLALVMNPYQKVGTNVVKQTDEVMLAEGKEKTKRLIEYMRKKSGLEKANILVTIYYQNQDNAILPGNYAYEGMTTNNNIPELNQINEKYYLMLSGELAEVDVASYNAFVDLEKQLKEVMPQISMMGKGLYSGNTLSKLNIEATITSDGVNEVLAVSQIISNQINSTFSKTENVKGIIKYNNTVKAVITKTSGQPEIYLVD